MRHFNAIDSLGQVLCTADKYRIVKFTNLIVLLARNAARRRLIMLAVSMKAIKSRW